MNEDDSNTISYYGSLLDKYGENHRALNWGSQESQIRRFEILAEIGLKLGDSVMDVGCGLADFYAWLKEKRPGITYAGLDLTPAMVEKSRKRFPDIEFKLGTVHDHDQEFDYLVASGIFVYRETHPVVYMNETIQRMFELSKKGVAFNSLSFAAKDKAPGEFYADPCKTFRFCQNLTPRVILRHDYHPNDFTIYMHKG